MNLKCPQCGMTQHWSAVANNLQCSSDCSYVEAEFKCWDCQHWLRIEYQPVTDDLELV